MPRPRYSTIYDQAALRLLPNGTRIAVPSSSAASSSSATTSTHRGASAVQDAQGNWIARDASGSGRVAKRRKLVPPASPASMSADGEACGAGAADDGDGSTALGADAEGKGEDAPESGPSTTRPRGMKDPRARRRRAFEADMQFIHRTSIPASADTSCAGTAPPVGASSAHIPTPEDAAAGRLRHLPLPSSDLLKTIHYFASHLYTEREQLHNFARTAKREKKLRRLARLKARAQSDEVESEAVDDAGAAGPSAQPDEERNEDDNDGDDDDDDQDPEGDDGDDSASEASPASTFKASDKKKKSTKKAKERRCDMYKALDGSALLAIGMLLQTHIVRLVDVPVPLEWDGTQAIEDQDQVQVPQVKTGKRRRKKKGKVDGGQAIGSDTDAAHDGTPHESEAGDRALHMVTGIETDVAESSTIN